MRGISDRNGDSVSVSVSNKTNVEQFTSQKEKFRKEARRLRKLRNPHIVAVHDLFEENGTAYYEMDLIKGESLSERMKRSGQPLGEAEVLQILDQVLDALSVVHAQGLYHLDLKPANIMVTSRDVRCSLTSAPPSRCRPVTATASAPRRPWPSPLAMPPWSRPSRT